MGEKWEAGPRHADVERWLSAHGDALYRYAFLKLRDRALAEDAVQETLLGALRSTHPPDGRASEKTWLFAILKHKLADFARSCLRSPLDQCIEPGAQEGAFEDIEDLVFGADGRWRELASWGDPVRHGEAQAFWRHLSACLEALPGQQGEVFMLREIEGLSLDDICQITGVSATNAYVLLHRARLGLRQCLARAGFGPED
ncbi:sigma-70 family RNA polymerase sigma factor [Acidiferrobacter sp.]|uniref:sigma-70 family RNA polymerase sigma factor n=1 Tax=Acidiferrobacter sp. TaxID=1872107 RepID=UPI00260E4DE2|nr:sigma-70 family RNA polymerase sigma factor [Acidiferrobacter sp.]